MGELWENRERMEGGVRVRCCKWMVLKMEEWGINRVERGEVVTFGHTKLTCAASHPELRS